MTGKIVIDCPPMPVRWTWLPWVHEAQELPCTGQLTLPDGTAAQFNITFPKCKVRWQGWKTWLVDEVTATGQSADGSPIEVTLVPERVLRRGLVMVAQAVPASGKVIRADGWLGTIDMVFPEVEAHMQSLATYLVTRFTQREPWRGRTKKNPRLLGVRRAPHSGSYKQTQGLETRPCRSARPRLSYGRPSGPGASRARPPARLPTCSHPRSRPLSFVAGCRSFECLHRRPGPAL
jgi:hypothetical protein